MNAARRISALIVGCLFLLGCNTADKHYWNWRNGLDADFSFSYLDVDPARSGDPEQIEANDFTGPGLERYSVADDPGVFYRSLSIPHNTRVSLVVFPPDQERGIVIARGTADGDAGVFSTSRSTTTSIQMFWIESIDWRYLAGRFGYGTYFVGWYWGDDTQATASHTFELTP